MSYWKFALSLLALLATASCGESETPSGSGLPQLSVAPGVVCADGSAVLVNGQTWDYPKGSIVPVSAGKYTISCKDGLSKTIEVSAGTTYTFDKWD